MPLAETAKKKGIKVYHLNIGQPDISSPKIFLKKIKEYQEKVIAYDRSEGREDFLKSFCEYYRKTGVDLKTNNMIATYGGSEALFMAFCILLNKNEECLTIEPFYTNYLTIAASCDVKLKTITTNIENNFLLPPINTIEKAIGPKTKAILVCNPNNPTGALYQKEILKELVDLCYKKNIFIISDDAYRDFVYDGKKVVSLLSFKKAKDIVVACDTLSKRYSLCGARLGVLISRNEKVIAAALKLAQSRTSISSILQYAASYLNKVPENYFKKIIKEYQSRRDTLIEGLKKMPKVKFGNPGGAFYLIAQFPVKNAEDFCRFLLEDFNYHKETVMLSPVECFYLTPGLGKNQVRIAYVLNCRDLQRSCLILQKALEKYKA